MLNPIKNPLISIAILCVGAMAQPAVALNLLEAYGYAQQNDANYASALAQYEASRLDLPLAKSANRPGITSDLDISHTDDEVNPDGAPSSSSDYNRSRLAFALNQNLYNRSIGYDIESAEYAVQIAELQLGIAQEELIISTVAAYLEVLSALDNQHLAELQLKAIGEQLDLATQRLDVGLGTKTDEYDAKARFETANADLIAAQNEVINTQQALEALMNRKFTSEPRQEMRTLDNDKVSFDLVSGDSWVEGVLQNNRRYKISQQQVERQRVEVDRTGDARWPTVGLYGGISATDSEATVILPGNTNQNWNVGVRASLPIYLGGSIKINQQRAGYNLNSSELISEQARRDTNRLIRAARRAVESLSRQVQAREQAVIAGKSALESKEEGFKAGVTTNINVLDAQRDLFAAGRDYFKANYDLVSAIIILERSSGELNEEDVARINSWLK